MVPAVVPFVLLGVATAVPTFLELPTNQTVVENGDTTLSCNATVNGARQLLNYRIGNGAGSILQSVGGNITDLSLVDGVVGACVFGEYNTQLILKEVTRQADGYTVTCTVLDGIFFVEPQNEPPAFLSVIYPPAYSILPNQPTTVLETEDFIHSFVFEAKPSPANFTWSKDGQVISSGSRIATSVSTITITSTTRSDTGVYEVVSYNEAGRGAGNFTLDVQYPPEYVNTASVQHTQLMVGATFTVNCTPSSANPPVDTVSIDADGSPVISSNTVRVTGNVLTIPLLQRSHSGNYSCNATNTRGSAVIYHNLLVIGPPSVPYDLTLPLVGLSAAHLNWTAPEDDGGVSDRSWDPAIDGKQNTTTLTYTVTLTNGKDTTMVTTKALSLIVSNLQHSTAYTVTVVAENVYEKGPKATTVFNTVTDLLSAVIGLGVALGVALLFAGTIFTTMLLFQCIRKHLSRSKGEAELNQALPKSHPKSNAEPMYAECEGGMANSNVAMKENPAYQSVDVQ